MVALLSWIENVDLNDSLIGTITASKKILEPTRPDWLLGFSIGDLLSGKSNFVITSASNSLIELSAQDWGRLSQSSFGSILSFRKLDFELTSSQRPNWPCINYSKKLHKGTEELYYTLWSELYETFLVWYFVEWCEPNSSQWSLCPHHSVTKIHLGLLRYQPIYTFKPPDSWKSFATSGRFCSFLWRVTGRNCLISPL